jgi:hypothetical protein
MMGQAYSNNGLSYRTSPGGADLQSGEVFFAAPPTTSQLEASFPGYAAAKSAQNTQASIEAAIMAGLQIVCTSNSALNGTYGIDASSLANISGVAAGIASRNRIPGGGTTFNYGDINGGLHAFSGPEFLNFAAAVEDFTYALFGGVIQSQPVTIA